MSKPTLEQIAFNEDIEAAAVWHDEQAKRHREIGKPSDIANAMSHDKEAAAIRKLKIQEAANG